MNCFRTRGKKGDKHGDPSDPPRRRANKQRGHGTYANDRPPIVGTVGRRSGKVRLRVVKRTDAQTLRKQVQTFTRAGADVNTDEWRGYRQLQRKHSTVAHGLHEWARDDDGECPVSRPAGARRIADSPHGMRIREVHVNTIEGLWTSTRNFLRPFRGVHKRHLSQYVAMCEFSINVKKVIPKFMSTLVKRH